jgi:anti-anti-sigma regulatory factor
MLSVTISNGPPAVVTIAGDINTRSVRALYLALSGLSGDVVVDGTDIEFIDSEAFRAFDVAHAVAVSRGTSFQVFGLRHMARRVADSLALPYVVPAAA